MASVLQKAVKGGMDAGSALLTSDYLANRKAAAIEARDTRLRSFDVEDRGLARDQEISDDTRDDVRKRNAASLLRSQQLEDRDTDPKRKKDTVEAEMSEDLQTQTTAYLEATTDDERLEAGKNIMAVKGTPVEGKMYTGRRYMVHGTQVFDTVSGEDLDLPGADTKAIIDQALKVAKAQDDAQVDSYGDRLPEAKDFSVLLDEAIEGMNTRYEEDAGKGGGKGPKSLDDLKAGIKDGTYTREEAKKWHAKLKPKK